MSDLPEPLLRLAIDREALRANWTAVDRLSGGASAGAAVKANAYGLGTEVVVPELLAAGCRDFFVAHPTEAVDVIRLVDPSMLSILHGPLTQTHAQWMMAAGVKPVINSLQQARRWQAVGGGRCDLMVDTGINRLGLPLAELGDDAIGLLDVDVLMSHLSSAEETTARNTQQLQRWREARGRVSHRRASLANSAGIALGPDYHGDLTRPGLALYGGIPCEALSSAIRQVVTPEAAIMQVREIGSGDSVGYNALFVAKDAMRVGTIALGYADGYLRCWTGRGVMRGDGQALPVLGRVSMDMTVIDLTNAPELREGDWVSADYHLPFAAAASGLSQYELLTSLGNRFRR